MPKTANAKFMAPVQPDEVLGAIVGMTPMPRTQITSKLWVHIREHAKTEGRIIIADEKLKALFDGAEKASMFELPKFVKKHMVKG